MAELKKLALLFSGAANMAALSRQRSGDGKREALERDDLLDSILSRSK